MRLSCHVTIAAVIIVTFCGCEAPAPTRQTFTYLRLPSTPMGDAFRATRQAMAERFRIDQSDSDTGVITSVPEEQDAADNAGQLGDAVGVPRRMRRVAEARVTGSSTTAEVWCRVVVERNVVNERGMFVQDMARSDLPDDTPSLREGATTPEQNAIWRVSRRDKVAEQSIRRAVVEILDRRHDVGNPAG